MPKSKIIKQALHLYFMVFNGDVNIDSTLVHSIITAQATRRPQPE